MLAGIHEEIMRMPMAYNSLIGDMEDDGVLLENNGLYAGNYLNEESLLAAARAKGFDTAAIAQQAAALGA